MFRPLLLRQHLGEDQPRADNSPNRSTLSSVNTSSTLFRPHLVWPPPLEC